METEIEEHCSPRRSYGARSSTSNSSPEFEFEFEFWMVDNHPELEPNLHSADELFVDGVLLPLHNLSISSHPPPLLPNSISDLKQENQEKAEAPLPQPPPPPTTTIIIHPDESSILSSSSTPSPSKRWKDIFKKKEVSDDKEKKKKERKTGVSGGGNGITELNINIWPFSRSRSAGTAGRVKPAAAAMRKSSSAPCSRSNSRGENTGRRWAASPGRPGIHVGRASPVWQVKRAGKGPEQVSGPGSGRAGPREKLGRRGVGGGVRGLNLNVNGCIGYRNQGRCRGEGSDGGNGSLFRFKALFAKKVY